MVNANVQVMNPGRVNKKDGCIPRGEKRPWLFEAFPGLTQGIPWTPLVEAPTPVQRLAKVSAQVGSEIWIKRDDRSSQTYGGNKPRKLEFILGDALAQNRTTLVTGGGLGTNHGLATTIFGKKFGFRVILGLFDQPVTSHVRKNLLLYKAYGAEIMYVGSLLKAVLRYYVTERIRHRGAYFIAPGGSSPLGALGYVDAALELAMQVVRNEAPLPKTIYVAVGTCGTMAGLVLGLRLAGLDTKVIGVQVAPGPFANPRAVLRLAGKTLGLMQRNDRSVPKVELTLDTVPVDSLHFGAGYGHPTDAARDAIELMSEAERINLDLTYTGKAFGALLDNVKAHPEDEPVLFWNTFNSVDLSSVAESLTFQALPEAFHRFFQGEVK
jgi:D-cysteine desulfhydrase